METQASFVFIMIRHVQSEYHNNYWITCYKSIRQYYPTTPLLIVDNESDPKFVQYNGPLEFTKVIQAPYPKSRFFSPFFEFLNSSYRRAVIIHDGIVFNTSIDFSRGPKVKFFWHFENHSWDLTELEQTRIKQLNNCDEVLDVYNNKSAWFGCMGCICVIDRDIVEMMENRFSISIFKDHFTTIKDQQAFERIFAALCYTVYPEIKNDVSYLGDIRNMKWGLTYAEYEQHPNAYQRLPILKLFCSRP